MKNLFFAFFIFLFTCNICSAYGYPPIAQPIAMPNPVYDPSFYQQTYTPPRHETTPLNYNVHYNDPIEWSRQHDKEMRQNWQREQEIQRINDSLNGLFNRFYYGY